MDHWKKIYEHGDRLGLNRIFSKLQQFMYTITIFLLSYLKNVENANFTDVNIVNAKSYLDQMSLDPNWWKNGIPLSNLIRTGNTYIPFSKIPL